MNEGKPPSYPVEAQAMDDLEAIADALKRRIDDHLREAKKKMLKALDAYKAKAPIAANSSHTEVIRIPADIFAEEKAEIERDLKSNY